MAKNKPRQQPLKAEVSGNNDESRKLMGIPLAGPSCNEPAKVIKTIQVTPATNRPLDDTVDHEGTKSNLVGETVLSCGTVVRNYA